MKLQEMFAMQKSLDDHIEKKHGLEKEDLFDRKVLALLVEIGELANETRCFKYWSLKPSSPQSVILEEFVDGIHFILSLGLECGFEEIEEISGGDGGNSSMSEQFLQVFQTVDIFRSSRSLEDYIKMFRTYLRLAAMLGFTERDIKKAYISKNEINFERQEQGY